MGSENFKSVQRIKVSLNFGTSSIEVGSLVEQNQTIFFQYDREFLKQKLEISPFKFKMTEEIIKCPKDPFDGLPGVFNDSIPDGWGRLLIDRKLIEKGISPSEISLLDRLSLVGKNGQGALVYEPYTDEIEGMNSLFDLDEIANKTKEILKNGNSDYLENLYHLGGNSVGARPKILVNYSEKKDLFGLLPTADFEPWIVKFSALNDLEHSAKIEFAFYLIAKDCGIEMNTSKLFFSEKGRCFFGTKRFDRMQNKRLHFHSACGLLHDNFRYSTLDYGHIMDAANKLENNMLACEKVFKLAAFNVFGCNMDDHSKNIGFLMDDTGKWNFAPAYDLTFSPARGNFQSLSVGSKYQDVGTKELLKLASVFDIKHALKIIDEVKESFSKWNQLSSELAINKKESTLVEKAIERKLKM
ncbi:MAG: type II toxin-antitoxin system HipA family toxin [Flavobacteriales bacterium]|nr:type II toxin-antitoxin system HipA family toxin [Flavobacteriales bacterium]